MAFRIDSFDELNRIADRLDDRASEMDNVKTKAMGSLDNLKTNIVCDNITEIMESLRDSINKNTEEVNALFNRIAIFIRQQTGKYEETTETAKSNLESSAAGFEAIK